MWHSKGFIHKCTAGESKEFVGAAKEDSAELPRINLYVHS